MMLSLFPFSYVGHKISKFRDNYPYVLLYGKMFHVEMSYGKKLVPLNYKIYLKLTKSL